jgi:hypothetical protein
MVVAKASSHKVGRVEAWRSIMHGVLDSKLLLEDV